MPPTTGTRRIDAHAQGLCVISASSLFGFILTCAIIEITPGPNMAWLAALSIARGRRTGFAAVAGVALGLSAYGIAAGFGVAAIIENSPFLYQVLRWGGVAFLLWLAWEGWSTAGEIAPEVSDDGQHRASAFRRGLITNLLNPKAAVFYVAMLPEFVNEPAGNIIAQTLTLSGIYVAIATAIHGLIVLLASSVRGLVARAGQMKRFRRGLALALVGVAVWLAWSTAP
jgi:threonine/homoserine/homoserine lactone efflux protein